MQSILIRPHHQHMMCHLKLQTIDMSTVCPGKSLTRWNIAPHTCHLRHSGTGRPLYGDGLAHHSVAPNSQPVHRQLASPEHLSPRLPPKKKSQIDAAETEQKKCLIVVSCLQGQLVQKSATSAVHRSVWLASCSGLHRLRKVHSMSLIWRDAIKELLDVPSP